MRAWAFVRYVCGPCREGAPREWRSLLKCSVSKDRPEWPVLLGCVPALRRRACVCTFVNVKPPLLLPLS